MIGGAWKFAAVAALALLGACAERDLSDPRARALLAMPAPQHYANRIVARELAGSCGVFGYDEELAEAMTRARLKAGAQTSIQARGASQLEADVLRRSMAARYGASRYSTLDPCQVLSAETAQQTPLSVLVKRRS